MVKIAAETRFELQRDRMLKAAASCFNAKGYSGTSLKDVADHLGLTDAALYYYVRNKEELVYQCYLRAAELGREAMDRGRCDGQCGFEQAYLYISYHVEIFVGDRGPVAIMSEIRPSSRSRTGITTPWRCTLPGRTGRRSSGWRSSTHEHETPGARGCPVSDSLSGISAPDGPSGARARRGSERQKPALGGPSDRPDR